MENASNALIIAGGVLITIILIGSLAYMYNAMVQYPAEQEHQLQIEQLDKFNSEYEAYQKNKMYGTDVVTILNKAINNNNYNNEKGDKEGFYNINVEITLIDDIISYTETYDINEDGTMKPPFRSNEKVILQGGRTYSLISNQKDIKEIIQGAETKKINIDKDFPEFKYTMVYSGFRDFKRKYFECTDIKYSKETGRVNKIIFKEIKKNDAK